MIRRVRETLVLTLQSLPRRVRIRAAGRTVTRERIQLSTPSGNKVVGYVYEPAASGQHPAVLLIPGTNDAAAVFDGWSQPLNAREVAAQGWVVMTFDPPGRGESWGEEEYGGVEQQQAVCSVLRHLSLRRGVDSKRIGVVSISLGIGMACGALAAEPDLPVQWLVDWEGPSDREIITSGQRIMTPALGHAMNDEVYWRPREARNHVGALHCGYWRIQARPDHAQGSDVRHAVRMLDAAAEGTLPWFQLNHHPKGRHPKSPNYFDGGRMAANRALLSALATLQGN